jgi:hypothetical protein
LVSRLFTRSDPAPILSSYQKTEKKRQQQRSSRY